MFVCVWVCVCVFVVLLRLKRLELEEAGALLAEVKELVASEPNRSPNRSGPVCRAAPSELTPNGSNRSFMAEGEVGCS